MEATSRMPQQPAQQGLTMAQVLQMIGQKEVELAVLRGENAGLKQALAAIREEMAEERQQGIARLNGAMPNRDVEHKQT